MKERHFGPVWFIPGENRGKYPYCHSIFIPGAGILIDPASDRGRLARLREENAVREIWLSHWHEDHFMHLDLFDDLPLATSAPDAHPLSSLDALLSAYGLDEDFRDYWVRLYTDFFHFKPRKPSRILKPGEIVVCDSLTIQVIATPGHTPGHLSFYFKEAEVLFTGDYDLTSFGPWYGDVNSSISSTIESVRRLQTLPAKVWLTSHETGVFEDEPGRLWEKYLQVIQLREEKLLELLEEPRSMAEIINACIIYRKKREPLAFFEFGERAHMRKHLEKLTQEGLVLQENDKYRIVTS